MTNELRQQTLFHFYFGAGKDFKFLAINRAFRDLSRTLHLKDKSSQEERDSHRKVLSHFLEDRLNLLLSEKFNSEQFDEFHEKLILDIRKTWNEMDARIGHMTVGHAQKWINMVLKYWLILGETEVKGIETNMKYFHIPIDSIVLEVIFKEKYPETVWSKIEDYQSYKSYQDRFREDCKKGNLIPILEETQKFNTYLKEYQSDLK